MQTGAMKSTDSDYIDKRTICARTEPANKLTSKEKHMEMLEEFPYVFTIRHKVFLTYHYRKDME